MLKLIKQLAASIWSFE